MIIDQLMVISAWRHLLTANQPSSSMNCARRSLTMQQWNGWFTTVDTTGCTASLVYN